MNVSEAYTIINFYINKEQGGWYPPEEVMSMLDRYQISLYDTYYTKYATSQRLDDALSPFNTQLTFTNLTTPNGVISPPGDYFDLLSIYTIVTGSDNVTRKRPVEMVNEEELVIRLNSQVVPVTVDDPIGILKQGWTVQLYPAQPAAGVYTYLKRPNAPVMGYSILSGRVIVYDPTTSVQLQWSEKDQHMIILMALNGLGINLSEPDILQWSELKTQQNFTSIIKQ